MQLPCAFCVQEKEIKRQEALHNSQDKEAPMARFNPTVGTEADLRGQFMLSRRPVRKKGFWEDSFRTEDKLRQQQSVCSSIPTSTSKKVIIKHLSFRLLSLVRTKTGGGNDASDQNVLCGSVLSSPIGEEEDKYVTVIWSDNEIKTQREKKVNF